MNTFYYSPTTWLELKISCPQKKNQVKLKARKRTRKRRVHVRHVLEHHKYTGIRICIRKITLYVNDIVHMKNV